MPRFSFARRMPSLRSREPGGGLIGAQKSSLEQLYDNCQEAGLQLNLQKLNLESAGSNIGKKNVRSH
jgi:hypothetical protein